MLDNLLVLWLEKRGREEKERKREGEKEGGGGKYRSAYL